MRKLSLPPVLKYSVDKLRFSIDISGMIKDGHTPRSLKDTTLDEFKWMCKVEASNGFDKKVKACFKREFHNFACWVKIPVRDALQRDEVLFAKIMVFIDPCEKPNVTSPLNLILLRFLPAISSKRSGFGFKLISPF